jgi:hypothetical protein
MPTGGGVPKLTNQTFDKLEDAEWHVFKLRWKDITGQDLPIE